jgi:hypothetical protein
MNIYHFDSIDIEIILNALSYTHWNDRELTEEDRDYMDGLYQSIEESYKN